MIVKMGKYLKLVTGAQRHRTSRLIAIFGDKNLAHFNAFSQIWSNPFGPHKTVYGELAKYNMSIRFESSIRSCQ